MVEASLLAPQGACFFLASTCPVPSGKIPLVTQPHVHSGEELEENTATHLASTRNHSSRRALQAAWQVPQPPPGFSLLDPRPEPLGLRPRSPCCSLASAQFALTLLSSPGDGQTSLPSLTVEGLASLPGKRSCGQRRTSSSVATHPPAGPRGGGFQPWLRTRIPWRAARALRTAGPSAESAGWNGASGSVASLPGDCFAVGAENHFPKGSQQAHWHVISMLRRRFQSGGESTLAWHPR